MPDTHGETDASKVKAVADWTRRDMDAFAQIIQNMEDGALVDVVECKTAHEAWTCITQRWERNKAESLFNLYQQLTNTKIGEDEELIQALNNLRSIASRMEMLSEPVSDMMLAHLIINALPPSYAVLGIIIQMSDQNHTISSNTVINAALVEEGRRKIGLGLDTQLPKCKANHKGQK
ncbi:Copia-like polyprotein/retrotransposon [Ceratobasidium theobromae]|uniref:Copia-like polyprotein/retrotransposon n=1 Tax=Ceratobasidium theobromae TaxID=1582974 RepID=A0A5N5QCQ6_9AGAM|nr:Copia-like polyprotein/retrotransposon [Ceratobasidium theobromae]